MLEFYKKATNSNQKSFDDVARLSYHERHRSRLKIKAGSGREVGIFLERGEYLECDDLLVSDCGMVLKIEGEEEELAVIHRDDDLQFARACYHLGNRHVPLAIEEHRLLFHRDHVLEDMIRSFGIEVVHEVDVFRPEKGAYHQH